VAELVDAHDLKPFAEINMFLVTTADQRYWDTKEKICFLGEWCKVYDQKTVWSKLDCQVLPYHWDDRERMHKDFQHLDQVYERYLLALSEKLNDLHSTNYSLRYWRILIGPWLNLFIGHVFDKFLSIQTAKNSGLISNTWVCPFKFTDFLAKDIFAYCKQSTEDRWNHFIYGQIIKSMGGVPYEIKEGQGFSTHRSRTDISNISGKVKGFAKLLLGELSKWSPDSLNQIFITPGCFGVWKLARLQLSLRQIPCLALPYVKIEDFLANELVREGMNLGIGENQFELLLDELISKCLPKVYMEGYTKACALSKEAFPKRAKIIVSGASSYFPEEFRFWAADKVELGAKFFQRQYGGAYGSLFWMNLEAHEIKISDRYFSWGWKINNQKKVIPIGAAKLTGIKNKIRPDPEGSILWLGLSLPRYSYWMMSLVLGPTNSLIHINEHKRFVGELSPQARDLLLMRFPLIEYGWHEDMRITEDFPSLNVYRGKKSMHEELNTSRLSIHSYNSTTFLETLSANFPTILYWNPEFFELRKSAVPYFNILREAGILYDDPKAAAKKLNEIYEDPLSWWSTPEVQDARDKFCHQFARTNDNWIAEWKEELLKP